MLFVPDWDVEAILSEVEATAAALGRAFNGDKRLFAVEVGFVGFDASWQHGHSRIDACPLPSDASAQRIVKAMAEAFKDSFVLMPQPWAVPLFPYEAYPHMGIVDVNCGTSDMADNIGAVPALVDRWQTAPVFGVMRRWIERCWFSGDNATQECARFGTGLHVPDYVDAVSQGHASMVQHGALFKWVSRDPADNHRAREAYLHTGALVHLAQVTLLVKDAQLHVCALLTNLGTAPFHAPPSMPIALNLVVGTDVYELRSQSGGSIGTLLPNTTAAFASATVPWGEVDECTGDGAVCASHGQTCRDPDKAASSRGDWECVCAAGYTERGRVAVCKEVTLRRDEQRAYYKGKHDPIGEAVDHGMVGTSFTISTKVYVHACDTGAGCGNDYIANEWDQLAIIGMWEWPSGDRDWRGLSLKYAARGILASFLYHTCHWKDAPLFPRNAWAHMGIVYNKAAKTLQIYQNGAQMMVCSDWQPLKNTKLVIGKEFIPADPTNTVGQRHFKGWLKELRIMRGAATPQEMALLSQDAAERVPSAVVRLRLDTEFTMRPVVRFASADDGSGHAAVSAVDGGISFGVPPDDPSATPEPCFVVPPTPAPPRDLMDCAFARLETHGHDTDSGTEPGGTAHAQCNGLYRHVVRPRASTPSPPPPPPTPAPVPTPEFCRDYVELSDTEGTGMHPSNGTEYTNGERVCLRIRCSGRTVLRWTWFDTEEGYDYVTVSTVQESGALRYQWEQTGLLEMPPSDTFDGDVFIFFDSDASGTRTGFSFDYECLTTTPAPPAPTPAPPPLVEYWVKTAELDGTPLHGRELWPRDDGGLSCAFAADNEDGHLLVGDVYTPEWWSEFFICESRTHAPTTVSPPGVTVANHTWSPTAVPPPTTVPDTAAPPTAQPDTPVPVPTWPVYTVDPNGTNAPVVIAYTGSPYTLPPPTPTVSHTLTAVAMPPPTETEATSATESAEHADAGTATATEAGVATATATTSAVLDTPIPGTLAPGPVVYSQPQGGECPGPPAFKDGVCGSTECVCSYFAAKPAPTEAASHPCEGAATCRSGLQQWQIESLVAQHNFYRAHHGACPVAYSKDVEEYTLGSDGFDTMCTSGVLTHNVWSGYGENYGAALDESAAHTYDPASSVRQWYCEEEGCYDYSAAVFGLHSRRFTQLVWGASTEVGCALCHLPTAGAGSSGNVFIMCNYKEPGNWAGEFTRNVQPAGTTPSGCPTTVPDTAAPDTAAPDTTAPNTTVPATGVPLTDVPLTGLPSATDAPTPAPGTSGTSDNTTAPATPDVSQSPGTAFPSAATGLPGTAEPSSGSPVAGATASPLVPSPVPSAVPSGVPSDTPAAVPSAVPAPVSSDMPSEAPSAPAGAPSTAPSPSVPSGTATNVPAVSPTTGSPTVPPTTAPLPTGVPSAPVTANPSVTPVPGTATATPPQTPVTDVPGVASTHAPGAAPSAAPTAAPTAPLTGAPAASTDTPPDAPSSAPGAAATVAPTSPADTDAPATAIQTHPPATDAPDTEAPAPAVKSIDVDGSFTITYSVVEGPTLEVLFVCDYGTWCGIAFGDTKSGADAVVCRGAVCTDGLVRGYSAPTDDAEQDVELVSTQVVGARLHYVWRRRLDTGDPLDKVLRPGHNEMITWLHGPLDSRGIARGIGVLELEAPTAPAQTATPGSAAPAAAGANSSTVTAEPASSPTPSNAAPETATPAAAANESSASPGPGGDVDTTSPEQAANDTAAPAPLPPTEAPQGAPDAVTATPTLPASSPEGAKPTATAVLDSPLTPVPFRWVLDAPTESPAHDASVSAAALPPKSDGDFGPKEVVLCIVAVFLCCGNLFIWAIVWRRRRESRRHWAVDTRTVEDSEMHELIKDKKDADPTLLPHDGLAPSALPALSQPNDLSVAYSATGATTPPHHGSPHGRSVLQGVSASSVRKDSLHTQRSDESGLISWRDDVSEDRQPSEGQAFPSRQPSCTFSVDELVALPAGAFPRRNSRRGSFARSPLLGLRSDASTPLSGLKAQHPTTPPLRMATANSSLLPTRSELCGSSMSGSPAAGTARRRASLSVSHIGLAPPRRRCLGSPCLSSTPAEEASVPMPLAEDTSDEEGEEFLDSTQPANPLIQRAISGPSPPKREVNLEPACVLDVSDVGSVCTPFLDADEESQQNDVSDGCDGDPFLLGKRATEPADN